MEFVIQNGILMEYTGRDAEVQVPEDVVQIGSGAFQENRFVQKVVLPEGLKVIDRWAFAECTGLVELEFPETLTEIADYGFYGCKKLSRIVLPNGLQRIGSQAFSACAKLTAVTIPADTRVEGAAFRGCHLTHVDFCGREDFSGIVDSKLRLEAGRCIICGGKMEENEEHSGMYCTCCGREFEWEALEDWEHFVIEDGVCTDGYFPGGAIPDGVKKIAKGAFDDATVGEVEVPDSVTEIGTGAFIWCDFALRLRLPRHLKRLENRVLDGTNLAYLMLPEDLEYLSENSLRANHQLRELELGDAVRLIGAGALSGCDSLRELSFGCRVRHIGNRALFGCDSLKEIALPQSVRTIGDQAFSKCSNLRNVVLNEGLIRIGNSAFAQCELLEEIRIPSTVCAVGGYAFSGCDSLKKVWLPETLAALDTASAFPKGTEILWYKSGSC